MAAPIIMHALHHLAGSDNSSTWFYTGVVIVVWNIAPLILQRATRLTSDFFTRSQTGQAGEPKQLCWETKRTAGELTLPICTSMSWPTITILRLAHKSIRKPWCCWRIVVILIRCDSCSIAVKCPICPSMQPSCNINN